MPSTRSQRPELAEPLRPKTRSKKGPPSSDQGNGNPSGLGYSSSEPELQKDRESGDESTGRFDGGGPSPALIGRYPKTPCADRGGYTDHNAQRTDERDPSPQQGGENKDAGEGTCSNQGTV